MNLKISEAQILNKEELKKITAGTAPDCEPFEEAVPDGTGWICVPISDYNPFENCSLGLLSGHENENQNNGDNSGHGW